MDVYYLWCWYTEDFLLTSLYLCCKYENVVLHLLHIYSTPVELYIDINSHHF